jgi:hypothetical protein
VTSWPILPKRHVVTLIGFQHGGVAALVGNTYGGAKDVGVYVTGEAIRGLADLEAKERERCANFGSKAVAAGLAERTVRVAERQGQLMVEMVQAALREVDLSPEQASAFKAALARQAERADCVERSSARIDALNISPHDLRRRALNLKVDLGDGWDFGRFPDPRNASICGLWDLRSTRR